VIADIIRDAETKMANAIEYAKEEFAAIRTGRAHPAMFAKLTADYYGSPTPLQQLATFQVPDARVVMITPYDQSTVTAIEKSIRDSDLGLNPATQGNLIRVPLPALSEERRKELVKVVHKLAEEGRIAVRHARTETMSKIKKLEKVSEDDKVRAEKDVQKLTDEHIKQIDGLIHAKEAEIMEV